MLKLRRVKQPAFFIQVYQYLRICIFYEQSGIRSLLRHIALSVYKLDERKVIVASDPGVVFTECRCDMNDTGTVCHGNVIIYGYKMRFLVLFLGSLVCAGI